MTKIPPLKNIALLIVSVLVSLVLVELGFRLLINLDMVDYPKPDFEKIMHQYSDIKELVYELKPSFSYQNGLITTNRFGFRDHEYTLSKPDGITRICVIGDSVAFGYKKKYSALPLETTFPKLLESKLNAVSPGQYEVLNFSVTGYNSFQEEVVLKKKVLQFEPDIVILAYVHNDDGYTYGLGDLAREMSPSSLGSRLRSRLISYLLNRYEAQNARDKWRNLDKVWSLFEQLEIYGKRQSFDVIVLMSVRRGDFEIDDEKHDLVKKRAIAHGFTVVDLKEAWRDINAEVRYGFYMNKGHYSTVGMQRVTDELLEYCK
jgi:lysophospholipase L1-like esterase